MNTITVQPGQTLSGIYGNNWKQASGYNGDPTKLAVGTVLPAPASFTHPANTSIPTGSTYTPPPPTPMPQPQMDLSKSGQSTSGVLSTPASNFNSKPIQPIRPPQPQATHPNWMMQQLHEANNAVVPQAQAAEPTGNSTMSQAVKPDPGTDAISSPGFVNGTPDWVTSIIKRASDKYNIPTMLLSALLKQESGFNPKATSSVGAQGIAQFMPATAQGMGVDPLDPESAIMGAAKYLRQSWDKFGKPELALAAYNAGGGAVNQYGGIPPYKETQDYVKNIMAMASEPHQSANGTYLQTMNDLKKQSTSKYPGVTTPIPQQDVVNPFTSPIPQDQIVTN